MLTGYTSSVDYKGSTYHVQTEDKGLDARIIVSLVYDGGTVLASKRTPYDELMGGGYDADVLAKRLRQQHKLICAAILSGRLNDLKKLAVRDTGKLQRPAAPTESSPAKTRAKRAERNLAVKVERGLRFKAGDHKRLAVHVVSPKTGTPVKNAQVTVKVMGGGFRSLIMHSRTDASGMAQFDVTIPQFENGRGALVVTASHDDDTAELRRVVSPA